MKLEDRIYNVEYYVKKFNSWEVKEINNEVLHAMIILPECTYANDCI